MPEEPLQVRLEQTDHQLGHFLLTFNSSQYPIVANPDASVLFSDWLRRLHPVLSGQRDPAGELASLDLLRNVGTWLWQALLPDSAPAQQRDALAYALRTGRTPLLLALPDTLAGLPWELLCDPQQPTEQGFLARRRPLMRLVSSDMKLTLVTPPLHVLLLISSPPTLGEDSRVDVESERAAVEQATRDVREFGLLHLLVEDIVTPRRVQQALVRFKPHVVHYIGHGRYDEATGGLLLWEDELGNELPLSGERLAAFLRPRSVSAVVLHACQTGRSDAQTEVRGISEMLVHEGIPTVLAQQANFTYDSSQRSSEAWYHALAAGQSFAEALFEVRQALTLADRPDWAVPILQGSTASLASLLNSTVLPGSPDPLLTSWGAAADLPAPTGVFVGRHRELRELRLMLENAPGSGPVMALITGPGGIGKSTLAAQAVTRYGGKYKAALTLRCQEYQSIDLFLQRIGEFLKRLGMLGFLEQCLPDPKLSTEAKIEEAVVALNATGPLLLVIDNLESAQNDDQKIRDGGLLHLLQKLLTNLRGGRVLITGRYAVKDLLPQGKFAANLRHLNLDDLSTYETNQLLMRHPSLARLSEVVRQKLVDEFGGLPYVYDLLSSKAAVEDLERIIYEVREYGTVKQKTITEERKQHTAEVWQKVRHGVVEFATLKVIVSRLSGASRTLLAQLGVLQQPFPLAAIEEGLAAVPTAWQPLIDWSLLYYDPHEQTYYLHSITRHYVKDLLNVQDRRQTQIQLAAWYEHYADHESHSLADYLETHRLLREAGSVRQAGELVIQLVEILRRVGLYPLLGELLMTTLDDIGESDELLSAKVLYSLGLTAFERGNYQEAQRLCQESLTIEERLDDQPGRAISLHQLGNIAFAQGSYQEAQRFYQQSLAIKEQQGTQKGRAMTLHQLGNIAFAQGSYQEAQRFYQQSLAIKEQQGDQYERATTLHQLGSIAFLQGNYQEALRLCHESLAIWEQQGDQSGRAESLRQLGNIAKEQGNYQEARQFCQQSLTIYEQLGDQHGCADSLYTLGTIVKEQGNYQEARQFCQQTLAIYEQLGDQRGRANSLHELGGIAEGQENYQEAQRLYQQGLAIYERLGNRYGCAGSLGRLGNLAYKQGDIEQALVYTIQAYILYDFLHSPSRAAAQRILAKIRSHMGEATFTTCWQAIAGKRPLPPLLVLDKDMLIDLCVEVTATLQTGNAGKKEVMATHLEQILRDNLLTEDVRGFLQLLTAWLREQDTQPLGEKLQPLFRDIYARMVAAVKQDETEHTEENEEGKYG